MRIYESVAHIGDVLLKAAQKKTPDLRTDIRGIGLILVELMEQTTSALNPNDLKIKDPETWTDHPDILAFIADTNTHSLTELTKHAFLPAENNYGCFATYALLAQLSAYIPVTVMVESK